MNTLDKRIIFFYSGQNVTGHAAGMYPYYVRRYRQGTSGTDVIFAGNFFYNGSDTSITFDVTDIIASDGYVAREDDFQGVYTTPNKIVNRYYMKIVWDDDDVVNSSTQWVAKVYGYKNKNLQQYFTFFEPIGSYYNNWISILMQGFSRNQDRDSKLIPHYPMFLDEQSQEENDCPFGLALLAGQNISGITSVFEVDGEAYQEDIKYERYRTITPSGNSFSYISNVGNVADYRDIMPTSDGVLWLTDKQFVTTLVSPDLEWEGTYLYRRYKEGDRDASVYLYKYAYVRINNSHGKFIDDSSVNIYDIDTTNIVYCETQYPDAFDSAYSSGGTEYVIGDDGEYRYTYNYKAAIFDMCPKRFYLFWQDRFGSFQCQAFNDIADYSESFDRSEVQDYQNRRRNANIQVQSKWKINSGWIPEDLYPYYESIYTSPFLILYDSERDMRHTVMVSGDYEEKTYKNQKRLINMNLELTENKKQNIIY